MVDDVLHKFGQKIVEQLREDIKNKPLPRRGGKSYVANASGDLQDTLRYEVSNGVLKIYANHYIYQLIYGRKPGKKPPRDVIVKWIQDKGIQSDIPINSLAFLIQRSIGENGTLLFPQGSTLLSDIVTPDLINDLKSDLFSDIVDAAVSGFRTLKQAA
jgi:hypothetical protein